MKDMGFTRKLKMPEIQAEKQTRIDSSREEIIRAYKNGSTITNLSAKYKINKTDISGILHVAKVIKITKLRKGSLSPEFIQQLAKEVKEIRSLTKVAEKYGLSDTLLSRSLKRIDFHFELDNKKAESRFRDLIDMQNIATRYQMGEFIWVSTVLLL